jgi:hypothetical protein
MANPKENQLYYFSQYACFYYSASNAPWEAAYINCFDKAMKQIGRIIFTYEGATIPAEQTNRMDPSFGVIMYYPLSRFDDVINLLRYAVNNQNCPTEETKQNEPKKCEVVQEEQSLLFSVNEEINVWALCHNLWVPNGAQYHV